ncbi:MAG: hypothetical protein RMJ36_00660 [Candidatus Calescibacterium sp.]|nr:hypothetical protein [Candidatus Calescibacterium sp.]MDW8132155.1 hypothetical protein [Candidatus Calescibacterium sp.]
MILFFLCNPTIILDVGVGWAGVPFGIIVHYFFYRYLCGLYIKDKISKELYSRIRLEKWFILGYLGSIIFFLPDFAILFIIPAIVMFIFPFYFTYSFITVLISKDFREPLERKLLLYYYGVPTFSIIVSGILIKFALYHSFSNIVFYYANYYMLLIFIIFFLGFLIFYNLSRLPRKN